MALELMRRIREMAIKDIEDYLARIDPALISGSLTPRALPGGTMVNRGDYATTANYRPGDMVQSSGASYVAVAASTAQSVTNPTYFARVAAGALAELSDVLLTGLLGGDILIYDSVLGKWVNQHPGDGYGVGGYGEGGYGH